MDEIEPWKDPQRAENELIETVRGEDVDEFALTISRIGTIWTVTTRWRDKTMVGTGPNFAEAWHGQVPSWTVDDGY
jgi:hypothetical protein